MAAIAITGAVRSAKSNIGSASLVYVQASRYSTDDRKVNIAAWKRGTGGRSSFNGIVATVFGCTGFVGKYVCTKLGRTGTQLILPHRGDHYDCMRLKVVGDLGQVLFQPFTIRDQESIDRAVKYSNVVINLIGRDYETKNYNYQEANVESARIVARACANAGVDRLIHLSYLNSAEYPDELVVKGGSRFKASKWLGEQAVKEEFPDVTIIKASDIYGSEDRFLRAYTHYWRKQGQAIPLWFNGQRTEKQPVFVSDVAQGIINAAKDPDTKGKVYQAIGPKRYLQADLVDWFQRVVRKDEKWGYRRYDMRYDPFFQMRITLNEKFSPGYPLGYLHWEGIERETTTDVVDAGVPTLEDLGITLTKMEDQVPWELRHNRANNYYGEELGEFEKPAPPPVIHI